MQRASDPQLSPRLAIALALGWIAALYLGLAALPFFADSYSRLAFTAQFSSWTEVFDLEQQIYRPCETLLFYVLNNTGLDQPWIGRLAPFAMHLGVCALLYCLARRLGAGPRAAAIAVLLFALTPNTKSLGWVMAHGTQGRALFVLAGFLLFLDRQRRPVAGVLGSSACLVIGLMFHPGAIELPALCLLWVLVCETPWPRACLRALSRALASPTLLAQLALGLGYVVFTLLLPNRYHGPDGLRVMPANLVRTATFALPEELRWFATEGLRGQLGPAAAVAGGAVVFGVALLLVALAVRGRPTTRFLVLAVLVDLAPALISGGFTMRYGYLSFGLIAVGLALWLETGHRTAILCTLVLGLCWIFDTVRDVLEQRQAGEVIENIVADAGRARQELGPGRNIVLVDIPDSWGRELDIALLNWGIYGALNRGGVYGPFKFWRTFPAQSSTEQRSVGRSMVLLRAEERGAAVLWFDPASRRMVPTE